MYDSAMKHNDRIHDLVAQLSLAFLESKLQDVRGHVSPLSTPVRTRKGRAFGGKRGGPSFPMPGSASARVLEAFKGSRKQTLASLAKELGLAPGLISTTLNGLKQRGLVRRGTRMGEWVAK